MRKFLFLLILLGILTSCTRDFHEKWPYTPPAQLNDGIPVGTLEEVGIEQQIVQHIQGRITHGDMPEIHSVLIMKDGKLVLEEYFKGHVYEFGQPNFHGPEIQWDVNTRHDIKSCSKSITTTCIYLAIEQGYINSIHDPIFDYLPAYQSLNNSGREAITLEHLVSMTSGFEWDEWSEDYANPENDMVKLYLETCEDPIQCILSKSVTHTPGTYFTYSGGNSALLGEIIQNSTGMDIADYANQNLFAPLGITDVEWIERFPNGNINAAGGVTLTPREMIKVGSVFLNEGQWMGNQLISEAWIENCRSTYGNNEKIKVPGEISRKQGYGYGWWEYEFHNRGVNATMFNAAGWGGQYIMVLEDWDMVIVFTGGTYAADTRAHEMVERFILPFVK